MSVMEYVSVTDGLIISIYNQNIIYYALVSIPGRVIPKTLEMVLDTSLLNTQQYRVRIKGKVEQSRERSSAPTYTSV